MVKQVGASASGRRNPITRVAKVAEAVAREIVRGIAEARLEPGAQLPSEAQMLEEYGVGRGSLREALRILEITGLITIRTGPGGGPIVNTVDTRNFGRMATLYFQMGGMTVRELVEARLVMEPMMARLAAQRRDPVALRRLRDVADGVETTEDQRYLADMLDFHRLVASASGNQILGLLSLSLEQIYHDRISGILYPKNRRTSVVSVHVEIARAIEQGKADEAERLMRAHMEEYAEYARKHYPGLMEEVVSWT